MSDDWLYGRSPGGRQDDGRPGPSGSGSRRHPPRATAARARRDAGDADDARATQSAHARPAAGLADPHPGPTTSPRLPRRPTSPAPPRPPAAAAAAPTHGGWRPRFRLRYLWVLLALWLVYLVAVPVLRLVEGRARSTPSPSGQRPADQAGTNYLLVGSDSRKGLTAEQRKKLHTGNAAGQRTDTIVLVHTGSGPTLTMSIPRDSLVPIPGHGTTKINAAFAFGGPKLLVRTVEQNTGIHIDHYVEIGLGGFVNIVDSVGGITICPNHRMDDKLANLHVKKGCQHADGTVALAYARSRHADPQLGDIARGGQQREVMASVGHKALSPWTVHQPVPLLEPLDLDHRQPQGRPGHGRGRRWAASAGR